MTDRQATITIWLAVAGGVYALAVFMAALMWEPKPGCARNHQPALGEVFFYRKHDFTGRHFHYLDMGGGTWIAR